jgi:hypothetical protein
MICLQTIALCGLVNVMMKNAPHGRLALWRMKLPAPASYPATAVSARFVGSRSSFLAAKHFIKHRKMVFCGLLLQL